MQFDDESDTGYTTAPEGSQSPPSGYAFQQAQQLFLPPIEELGSYATPYLTQLYPQLNQEIIIVTAEINGMKRKRNPTPEYQNEIQRFSKYKQDLKSYKNAFSQYLNQRYQTGQGIFFYNTPQELLNRLELLDNSLKAGNNGALPEYIQIAHRLRDISSFSNTQLNKLLRKYIVL